MLVVLDQVDAGLELLEGAERSVLAPRLARKGPPQYLGQLHPVNYSLIRRCRGKGLPHVVADEEDEGDEKNGADGEDAQGKIEEDGGEPVGRVTSGGFGPSLDAPVAMGYIDAAFATAGTKIELMVRGKARPAEIASLPFIPARYKR